MAQARHIQEPKIRLSIVLIIVVTVAIMSSVVTLRVSKDMLQGMQPQSQTPPGPQVFGGTLPCADCSGILTELTLQKNSDDPSEGEYVLKQTYQGKSTQPITTLGKWNLVRGNSISSNAIVIALKSADKVVFQNWQVIDNDTLQMLDAQKNEIKSPFNLQLKRE